MSHRQLFASGETIREQKDEIARLQAEIDRLRLTDAEREAVAAAIGWIESPSAEDEAMPDDYLPITDALRGLLKRTAL